MLNSDFFGDGAHGCNWDTMLALGQSALKQFWQVMMVSMNLPFGPKDNDEWGSMLNETMGKVRSQYSKSNLPVLFRLEAPRMLKALQKAGVDLPGVEDPEHELWDWCMEAGLRRKAGSKVTAARFPGSVASAQCNVEHWWIDKFCRTASKYICFSMFVCKHVCMNVVGLSYCMFMCRVVIILLCLHAAYLFLCCCWFWCL